MSYSQEVPIKDDRADRRIAEFMKFGPDDPRERLRELCHVQARSRRKLRFDKRRFEISGIGLGQFISNAKEWTTLDLVSLKESISEIWSTTRDRILEREAEDTLQTSEFKEFLDKINDSWDLWNPSLFNPKSDKASDKISGANTLMFTYLLALINEKLDNSFECERTQGIRGEVIEE
jgi:hypothetical protein